MNKYTVIEGGKVVVKGGKGQEQRQLAAAAATRFLYTYKMPPAPEGISAGRWWGMVKHILRERG